MTSSIFISYSRRDAAFALGLQAKLREQGWIAWLDTEELQTGQRWREKIVQAIAACDYFVLILSPWSIQSDNVVKELSLAESSGKSILPLMVEPVEVPDSMKYQLAGLQFFSIESGGLTSESGHLIERFLKVLLDALPATSTSTVQRVATARNAGAWDKQKVLAHLLLAIGPIAHLFVEALPDPLLERDRLTLEVLFQHHQLDELLLAEALNGAQIPPGAGFDPTLADWFRLQVGPIADLVWDEDLQTNLRQAPLKAQARLEQIGVEPTVVQELLNRLVGR